ncbi:MAG: TM2 domain-containing protein [Candidatus Saccharimonadales bacterium]
MEEQKDAQTTSTEPVINTSAPVEASVKPPRQRHFLAAFFLSFMWGVFGADRFYLGKIWTGLIKMLTFGGFGIWAIVDLSVIMSGGMRDKQGNELLDAAKYKRFATNTIAIFAVSLSAIILMSSIFLVYGISQFMNNGGLDQFMPKVDVNQSQNIDLDQVFKSIQQ